MKGRLGTSLEEDGFRMGKTRSWARGEHEGLRREEPRTPTGREASHLMFAPILNPSQAPQFRDRVLSKLRPLYREHLGVGDTESGLKYSLRCPFALKSPAQT